MDMQTFGSADFGDLRVIDTPAGTLFCGRDVATALGYANPADALNRHCKGVANRYPLQTPGGTQQTRFITEADVFRLIVSSKLPSAQAFEAWVFEEVLPSIRRHGAYMTPEKIEEALLDPDTIIRLATDLKDERAKRAALERENAAMAPKALFADAVAASKSSILVGELAKILKQNGAEDMGQNRLFGWLRENGYLMRQGSWRNMPTQRSMELGLFEIKETSVTHSDGHITVSKTPKVTGKGQQYFVNLLLSRGGVLLNA